MTRSELIAKLAAKNPTLITATLNGWWRQFLMKSAPLLNAVTALNFAVLVPFLYANAKLRLGETQELELACKFLEKKVPFFKMGKGMRER